MYPVNRPNRSSFFINYQPAGNLDTDPLWRLLGHSLRNRAPAASKPKATEGPEIDGLEADTAGPLGRFNQGGKKYQDLLRQAGGNVEWVNNSKEGMAALGMMTIDPQEVVTLKREMERWGKGSQWEELLKERAGDAYLPQGWQSFQMEKNGAVITRGNIDEARKQNPAFAIQNQREYLSPNASSATAEEGNKFIRDALSEAASHEQGGEQFVGQPTGLANYFITTRSSSSNARQISAARNNLINSLPANVQDGMFQEYLASGSLNEFVNKYEGDPSELRQAIGSNFKTKWLRGRIDDLEEEFRSSTGSLSGTEISPPTEGGEDASGYQNWVGMVNSDVGGVGVETQMRVSVAQSSNGRPTGKFNMFNVPAVQVAGGTSWWRDAAVGLQKYMPSDSDDTFVPSKSENGAPSDQGFIKAADLLGGDRILLNQFDGRVSSTRESNLLQNAYVVGVPVGIRAFPRPVTEVVKNFISRNGGRISFDELSKITKEIYPDPPIGMSGAGREAKIAELDVLRKETKSLLEAYYPLLEQSNFNVDETPSSFYQMELAVPIDVGMFGDSPIANHPYLEIDESDIGKNQILREPGAGFSALGIGPTERVPDAVSGIGGGQFPFSRESRGSGISAEFNERMPGSSEMKERSAQVSDQLGIGVAVVPVLVGVRPEEEMEWLHTPDKKQGQFIDERARMMNGAPAQRKIDPRQ